jgi:polar amino acid transport system ATP-binding protein
MAFLEVKNIKKSFGKTNVLKGVDFSLERGEVLAIIGSSGGGKTTLLRCLNFLEQADEGDIIIGGKQVYRAEAGKAPVIDKEAQLLCGMVFQQFNLFPQYTVFDNLTLAPLLRAKRAAKEGRDADSKEQIFAKAEELISKVGLTEKRDCYPCQLSGGQQQRVAIARALILSPDILCFDEPTSALDPELTGEVLKVIRSLKDSDRTMIIVTHEMEFAKNVADKVIFVADGVIEESGTPEEVLESPKSEKVKHFLSVLTKE